MGKFKCSQKMNTSALFSEPFRNKTISELGFFCFVFKFILKAEIHIITPTCPLITGRVLPFRLLKRSGFFDQRCICQPNKAIISTTNPEVVCNAIFFFFQRGEQTPGSRLWF